MQNINTAPKSLMIVPVGVGAINTQSKTVTSQGTVELWRLDIIGYAPVGEDKQPALEQYVNGKIGLQELIAILEGK